jgi:hypothetical protein
MKRNMISLLWSIALTMTAGNAGAAESAAEIRAPLRWYLTCGDLLCGDRSEPAGQPACTTEEVGMPCAEKLARCGGFSTCGQLLICTDHDPRASGCPI